MAGVPFVGLTGGLGAGKSEALRALGEFGAVTLSTDAVVHELLTGDELRDILVERLGAEVAPNGRLDRSLIAERVFGADEAVREQRAGARGHAAVAERTGRQLTQAEKSQRADFEVRNDGTLEELRETLSRVLAKLEQIP